MSAGLGSAGPGAHSRHGYANSTCGVSGQLSSIVPFGAIALIAPFGTLPPVATKTVPSDATEAVGGPKHDAVTPAMMTGQPLRSVPSGPRAKASSLRSTTTTVPSGPIAGGDP